MKSINEYSMLNKTPVEGHHGGRSFQSCPAGNDLPMKYAIGHPEGIMDKGGTAR